MNEEVVIISSDTLTPVLLPATMSIEFQWHSWAAVGGPEECEAVVRGPSEGLWEVLRWLGYGMEVNNERGTTVWWGYVDEVSVRLGPGLEIGLSLEEVYNRVQVLYTVEDADGALQDEETDWAQDDASVDRYGTKEMRHSLADTTATAAEALRDRIVTQKGLPRGVPSVGGGNLSSGELEATIRGRGWYSTLGWKYYANTAGKEGHEETGGENQPLGVGLTASTIGFRNDPRRLFGVGTGFLAGTQMVVSGSTSNDGTYEVGTLTEQEDWTLTDATIYFEAEDDIWVSGTAFSGLAEGDVIQVEGSSSNDGIYEIQSFENDNHIEVAEKGIVAESAGASITIRRRTVVATVEALTDEEAGASITVTAHGVKVAQQFTPAVGGWTAAEVAVRVRLAGSPADSLKIELCADSSGSPGTVLDSGTLGTAGITTAMAWQVVTLSNTQTLAYGTDYWIVVSRTGFNHSESYYMLDVDEELGYDGGGMKLWTGSAWVDRAPDADLPFVVWGNEATSTQLEEIADTAGQFFNAVDVIDASGINTRQYRDGTLTARDEFEDLLQIGTSGGSRMLATVNRERRVLIFEQPDAAAGTDWQVMNDGRLVSALGEVIDPGRAPAGRWVHLAEMPGQVDAVASLTPFFVERATVHADGRLLLEPEGAPAPWDEPEIRQG